jgi:transposase-like protein
MTKTRRKFTAEQKAAIVRRHSQRKRTDLLNRLGTIDPTATHPLTGRTDQVARSEADSQE